MCGRYTFEAEGFYDRFAITNRLDLKDSYNIAPGSMMPIITKNGVVKAELMRWGLIPFWAKDPKIGYKMINARAESVYEKPAYRRSFQQKRCLVPASGFYEWQQTAKGKTPYYIHLKNNGLFSFAGLYDVWHDAEGKELKTFTIITTTPNKLVEPIHDRMPVMLKERDEQTWIDPAIHDTTRLTAFLSPFPDTNMEAYPVSPMVNSPENNSRLLLKPLHI